MLSKVEAAAWLFAPVTWKYEQPTPSAEMPAGGVEFF